MQGTEGYNDFIRKQRVDARVVHDHSRKFQPGDGPNGTLFDDTEADYVQWSTLPMVVGEDCTVLLKKHHFT